MLNPESHHHLPRRGSTQLYPGGSDRRRKPFAWVHCCGVARSKCVLHVQSKHNKQHAALTTVHPNRPPAHRPPYHANHVPTQPQALPNYPPNTRPPNPPQAAQPLNPPSSRARHPPTHPPTHKHSSTPRQSYQHRTYPPIYPFTAGGGTLPQLRPRHPPTYPHAAQLEVGKFWVHISPPVPQLPEICQVSQAAAHRQPRQRALRRRRRRARCN